MSAITEGVRHALRRIPFTAEESVSNGRRA
jgi:hypothetical protein